MTPQTMSGSMFGLGAVSSLFSGIGKYQSGQAEQDAYNYNAAITLQNMRDQMQANQDKTTQRIGLQAGGYAAAGVDIASGSPLLIMAATAARGAVTGQKIEEAGTEEAAMQRYYGKIAAFSGTMSGIGSFLSGLSTSYAGYKGATASTPAPSVGPFVPTPMGTGVMY